jgi:hypothetical protein
MFVSFLKENKNYSGQVLELGCVELNPFLPFEQTTQY